MSQAFYLPDHQMQDIVIGCWTDQNFRAAFIADPRKALAEWGIHLPDGLDIRVSEDTDCIRHLVIPLAPTTSELNTRALSGPRADSCTSSACRPCASYKDRGTNI